MNDPTVPHAHDDPSRELLRHTLATLSYRAAKALRGASEPFSNFRAGADSRSAGEILAHMCDLFDWATALAQGEHRWRSGPPAAWEADCARFFRALETFDEVLASQAVLGFPIERLFQGPIADALTHTGQLTMMRRLAGSPVRGENYAKADVMTGRVGALQADPRVEFD